MEKVHCIKDFDEVIQGLTTDLCWYACYVSMAKTQKTLNLQFDEVRENSLQESIFMYTFEKNLTELLEKHFYFCKARFTSASFNQAKDFFVLWMHDKITLDLSRYLNYLDEWVLTYPDWSKNHPVPLENMIIVRKD